MTAVLVQVHKLTPVQQAVREQFQEGGSTGVALLMIVGILALALIAYWLTRRVNRDQDERARVDDPSRLFRDLLDKLDLPLPQRRILDAVVKDLRLQHPAKILLSPTLFDRCVDQWGAARGRAEVEVGQGSPERLISQIRTALFPAVEPVFQSVGGSSSTRGSRRPLAHGRVSA